MIPVLQVKHDPENGNGDCHRVGRSGLMPKFLHEYHRSSLTFRHS